MYQIKLKEKNSPAIWIAPPQISIGCAKDNDLILDSNDARDHHASLTVKNGQIYLHTLTSANDILVNGKQLNTDTPIQASDLIQIGASKMEVIDPNPNNNIIDIPAPSTTVDKWFLVLTKGSQKGQRYPINQSSSAGRSSECDIHLNDSRISRKHVHLDVIGGSLRITDMNSANGTFINQDKINTTYARPGDYLTIGNLEFKIVGPFIDPDKTIISTAKRSTKSNIKQCTKSDPQKKIQNNTFIRREQILESKRAFDLAGKSKNNDLKTAKLIISITLGIAMLGAMFAFFF